MERNNIHIHVPAFPIAVGRIKSPHLRDRPVVMAPLLHQQARGVDFTPVYPPSKRPFFQERFILSRDENNDHVLLGIIYRMAERCSMRLRSISMVARRTGLMLRCGDHMEVSAEARIRNGGLWDLNFINPLRPFSSDYIAEG